jgi:isopenicillin N synthase-like dioxygenase
VDSYNTEMKRLAGKLLSLIAETLQLKPDFFEKKFGKPYQRMRMNYYPQCPTPDRVFGMSPHADMTGITLLLQDDEVVGLNVRKDDRWIAVQPVPYALVINVGNLIEVNL